MGGLLATNAALCSAGFFRSVYPSYRFCPYYAAVGLACIFMGKIELFPLMRRWAQTEDRFLEKTKEKRYTGSISLKAGLRV